MCFIATYSLALLMVWLHHGHTYRTNQNNHSHAIGRSGRISTGTVILGQCCAGLCVNMSSLIFFVLCDVYKWRRDFDIMYNFDRPSAKRNRWNDTLWWNDYIPRVCFAPGLSLIIVIWLIQVMLTFCISASKLGFQCYILTIHALPTINTIIF